eukprot:5179567-Prymnesium_polylepis.1
MKGEHRPRWWVGGYAGYAYHHRWHFVTQEACTTLAATSSGCTAASSCAGPRTSIGRSPRQSRRPPTRSTSLCWGTPQ